MTSCWATSYDIGQYENNIGLESALEYTATNNKSALSLTLFKSIRRRLIFKKKNIFKNFFVQRYEQRSVGIAFSKK